MRKTGPIFCYVTDRRSLEIPGGAGAEAALVERIRSAATAGVEWIQIREKDLEGHRLLALTHAAIAAVRPAGSGKAAVRVLVNDRLDVAWAAGADGVHLGEASPPVRDVAEAKRGAGRVGGAEFLVGTSCHSLDAARRGAEGGADYIIFGPVFPTPSKAEFGTPQGVSRLAEVCRAVRIPVLAIGGVTETNCAECLEAGAAGIAGIRLFQRAGNLAELLAKMR